MRAQFFHYRILEVKPIEALEEFKDHRRLQVFYHKGCKCVECGIEATQIGLGEGRGKKSGLHWDLYTDDFYPLTVDHIIPKSRGGGEELENKQPMCYRCNQRKGSRLPGETGHMGIYSCIGHFCKWPVMKAGKLTKCKPKIGDHVWKKPNGRGLKYLGIVSKFVTNPHTGRLAFMLEGNDTSMHHVEIAYKVIE